MSAEAQRLDLSAPPPLRLDGTALFLDLDGTLAPLARRPQDVAPDARRTRLLERLTQALDGRLAVVSGRTLDDVDRILEGRVPCVAAVHGLVRRGPGGRLRASAAHPGVETARRGFRAFAEGRPGMLVEMKGASVALHFRQARAWASEAQVLARRLARETGLTLQPGDMVVELRTPGPDKGDAIRAFLAEPPFRGAQPVFAGDDITDEHGFDEASAAGGFGVLVGAPRPTAARYGLRGVQDLIAWLEAAR